MRRLSTILMAGIMLTACTTAPRDDVAAPVVQVTPRGSAAPTPVAEPAPAKPAAPVKQQTRVFAYRDPATEPDPQPVAEPPPQSVAAAPLPAPVQSTAPGTPTVTQAPQGAGPIPESVQPAATPEAPAVSPPPPAVEPPPVEVAAAPPAATVIPGLPPAADALARQAEQQRQAGDYAGAAASLERSLRIAPREAYLWNRLARVRLEQGQSGQAGNLAARSNDLAGDAPTIKQDNWRIIAEARRRSGDTAGATEAERRASGN